MAVHLISGGVGAGKSTYAREIAEDGAACFHMDDWLADLFLRTDDAPSPLNYDWILERAKRLEGRFVAQAAENERNGVSSILDVGLMEVDQRDRIADHCAHHGITPTWHLLEVEVEERWNRVRERNKTDPIMQVSREMFDFMDARTSRVLGPRRWHAHTVGDLHTLRPATPADAEDIDDILQTAFEGTDEAELVRDLTDALALVLHDATGVVGVVYAFPMVADAEGMYGIAPVAVHPDVQGKGLGAALMNEVLLRLEGNGARAVVLLGDPDYYARFGFEAAANHGVSCRWSGPAFQIRVFHDCPAGPVQYPPAFDRFAS